jgi:hypothetical protein
VAADKNYQIEFSFSVILNNCRERKEDQRETKKNAPVWSSFHKISGLPRLNWSSGCLLLVLVHNAI